MAVRKRRKTNAGGGGLTLLDDALHALRVSPDVLLSYYIGSLPFVVGLIYFVSDMSRSGYAMQRCAIESLLLTLAFVWMKGWQSHFVTTLWHRLDGSEAKPWTLRRARRVLITQLIVQTTAAPVLLLSSLAIIPVGWFLAFYQNILLYGGGQEDSLQRAIQDAWRQACFTPLRRDIFFAMLTLFSFFVFINMFAALCVTPLLLKQLVGLETVFSRSPIAMLNTTSLTVALCLSFLVIDPLLKAGCILRCFAGEAQKNGQDLEFALTRVRHRRGLAMLLAPLLALCALDAHADSADASIDPVKLDQAIRRTLDDPAYSWRMPRERSEDVLDQLGPVGRFVRSIVESIRETLKGLWAYLREIVEKLLRWMKPEGPPGKSRSWGDWLFNTRFWLLLLAGVSLLALAWFGYRHWKDRRKRPPPVEAEAVAVVPDLSDEDVLADELAADDWLSMAQDLLASGEPRLALRAAYLAALSYLADQHLLSIARHKSNLDYKHELRRRAHQLPEMQSLFSDSVRRFDRVWYGRHTVTPEALEQFLDNVRGIRRHCENR
ncbi:MAG: DUF4129 domain-containing protein [Lentisphaeria bacterium]|nr:DUF4129 domain-containing protein [Lentisphaeria bacterium]